MNKKTVVIISSIFFVFLLFSSPFWLWQLKPSKEMNVLIVDKTVPDESYREHKGIVWLLNYLKLVKENKEIYDEKKDYAGFIPNKDKKHFDVRNLPKDLSPYDMIFIADSYGVYKDEYSGTNSDGSKSKLLYGGMTSEEVDAIKRSLYENKQTLVAEFNTFGSPTEEGAREKFYELLNIEWTGWIGRYFQDLATDEVPVWLKGNYEKQYGKQFKFSGTGLIFVDESDQVIVLTKEDLKDEKVAFDMTKSGEDIFGLDQSYPYNYWFDVVKAVNKENVQAEFSVQLSKSGKEKLTEYNLPTDFPAVIHYENSSYDSYYFAGDFVDQENVPTLYKASGLPFVQKYLSFNKKGRTDTFFWQVYVPMMTKILENDRKIEQKIIQETATEGKVKMTGKSGEDYLQVYRNGKWEDILVKGVNMGIAKPGSFPGETAIKKEEYARWFDQISKMNANALRIYTIHPPAFYEALYEHNLNRKDPLYLFHGVWVNEETFVREKNAFSEPVTKDFKEEIKRIVDIIHGKASIPERPGHASGQYTHDISPYLLGWVIGVEWDPEAVAGTNEKNKNKTSYDGKFIKTENASPFEAWLAEMMDYTATYEDATYSWQHPLSFTNWVTTDLLDHPTEPLQKEDLVSVNPNVIKAKDGFYPGLFASYHIYPYYPDFLNLEPKYVNYIDHRGEKNNYAGYLNDMKKHHEMPLLVAEFGIPGSRGLTHKNVYGRNQGFHSETEQGIYVKQLFEDIIQEKMAGGLVFTWQDEWFKRTWNTMDYDNPDRRPFWDNMQTNEQHFGMLSFDPQTEETQIKIDGETDDWERRKEKPAFESSEDIIKKVYFSSDERALYVRVDFDPDKWKEQSFNTKILLDTISKQGQSTVPGVNPFQAEGTDFVVQISNKEEDSRVLIDSYYDTFAYHYGEMLKMIPESPYASTRNNGVYHPIRLTLNKELTIKREGKEITIPFESYEAGKLKLGNTNPNSKQFDSLSDYYINKESGILELRLPWLLINFKDPSQKEIMGDIQSEKGIASSQKIKGISAAVIVGNDKNSVEDSAPKAQDQRINNWLHYSWDNWDEPEYHERLKKSYEIMQQAFAKQYLEK
ncbi:hypothetical protein [Metabacillus fastidiosus]|uniref:hypothetical protein n=1 Tax=Metabacillus fastidiosus TaxID=1458 RepID=UPI002E24D6C0|nr:hypothetical protein [Metabacillus fastidiosus]